MKGVTLAIVAALLAAGCGGSRPTLPVTVIDGYGVPLPGAKVYLTNSEEPVATTDDLGIARLSLSPGIYYLTINAKGHTNVVGEYVSIKEGEAPNPMFVRLWFLAPEGYFGRYLGDHVWETLVIELGRAYIGLQVTAAVVEEQLSAPTDPFVFQPHLSVGYSNSGP